MSPYGKIITIFIAVILISSVTVTQFQIPMAEAAGNTVHVKKDTTLNLGNVWKQTDLDYLASDAGLTYSQTNKDACKSLGGDLTILVGKIYCLILGSTTIIVDKGATLRIDNVRLQFSDKKATIKNYGTIIVGEKTTGSKYKQETDGPTKYFQSPIIVNPYNVENYGKIIVYDGIWASSLPQDLSAISTPTNIAIVIGAAALGASAFAPETLGLSVAFAVAIAAIAAGVQMGVKEGIIQASYDYAGTFTNKGELTLGKNGVFYNMGDFLNSGTILLSSPNAVFKNGMAHTFTHYTSGETPEYSKLVNKNSGSILVSAGTIANTGVLKNNGLIKASDGARIYNVDSHTETSQKHSFDSFRKTLKNVDGDGIINNGDIWLTDESSMVNLPTRGSMIGDMVASSIGIAAAGFGAAFASAVKTFEVGKYTFKTAKVLATVFAAPDITRLGFDAGYGVTDFNLAGKKEGNKDIDTDFNLAGNKDGTDNDTDSEWKKICDGVEGQYVGFSSIQNKGLIYVSEDSSIFNYCYGLITNEASGEILNKGTTNNIGGTIFNKNKIFNEGILNNENYDEWMTLENGGTQWYFPGLIINSGHIQNKNLVWNGGFLLSGDPYWNRYDAPREWQDYNNWYRNNLDKRVHDSSDKTGLITNPNHYVKIDSTGIVSNFGDSAFINKGLLGNYKSEFIVGCDSTFFNDGFYEKGNDGLVRVGGTVETNDRITELHRPMEYTNPYTVNSTSMWEDKSPKDISGQCTEGEITNVKIKKKESETIYEGDKFSYSLSFSDPDFSETSWRATVDWGDGKSETKKVTKMESTWKHRYVDEDRYEMSAEVKRIVKNPIIARDGTVISNSGSDDADTYKANVKNADPKVRIYSNFKGECIKYWEHGTRAGECKEYEPVLKAYQDKELLLLGKIADDGRKDRFNSGTVDWGDGSPKENTLLYDYKRSSYRAYSTYLQIHNYQDLGEYDLTVCVKDNDYYFQENKGDWSYLNGTKIKNDNKTIREQEKLQNKLEKALREEERKIIKLEKGLSGKQQEREQEKLTRIQEDIKNIGETVNQFVPPLWMQIEEQYRATGIIPDGYIRQDKDKESGLGCTTIPVSVQTPPPDYFPPIITTSDVLEEASLERGHTFKPQTVNFEVTAYDDVEVTEGPICSAESGDRFDLGSTEVICYAFDNDSNAGVGIFNVDIVDTTPPTITSPDDAVFEATGNMTALTEDDYGTATAQDIFDIGLLTSDAPLEFPLGVTEINWIATDVNGNLSPAATQEMEIVDTTPPELKVPGTWSGYECNIEGGVEDTILNKTIVKDLVDSSPTLEYEALDYSSAQTKKLEDKLLKEQKRVEDKFLKHEERLTKKHEKRLDRFSAQQEELLRQLEQLETLKEKQQEEFLDSQESLKRLPERIQEKELEKLLKEQEKLPKKNERKLQKLLNEQDELQKKQESNEEKYLKDQENLKAKQEKELENLLEKQEAQKQRLQDKQDRQATKGPGNRPTPDIVVFWTATDFSGNFVQKESKVECKDTEITIESPTEEPPRKGPKTKPLDVPPGETDPTPNEFTDSVIICHLPQGEPENSQTITIGEPGIEAHLAHGDHLGQCQTGMTPSEETPPEETEPPTEYFIADFIETDKTIYDKGATISFSGNVSDPNVSDPNVSDPKASNKKDSKASVKIIDNRGTEEGIGSVLLKDDGTFSDSHDLSRSPRYSGNLEIQVHLNDGNILSASFCVNDPGREISCSTTDSESIGGLTQQSIGPFVSGPPSEQKDPLNILESEEAISTYGKQGYSFGNKAIGTQLLKTNSGQICGLTFCSEKLTIQEKIDLYLHEMGLK